MAAIAAFALLIPATAIAAETPWSELKKLFHEPVMELKQQFNSLKQSGQAREPKVVPPAAVAKEKAPVEAATEKAPAVAAKKAPLPPEKPVAAMPAKPEAPAAEIADAEAAPIPRPRPEITFSYAADPAPVPPAKPAYAAIGALTPPARSLIAPSPAARGTCGAVLASLGVEA